MWGAGGGEAHMHTSSERREGLRAVPLVAGEETAREGAARASVPELQGRLVLAAGDDGPARRMEGHAGDTVAVGVLLRGLELEGA